jgi:hypothetical protein
MINLAATGMLLNIARHPAEHLPRSSRSSRSTGRAAHR